MKKSKIKFYIAYTIKFIKLINEREKKTRKKIGKIIQFNFLSLFQSAANLLMELIKNNYFI